MTVLHKKSILKKTFEVGSSTLASRCLGIIRELLMVRFLGKGPMSDAFITAFKIPNSLRKIFAEGALSAAFIPTLVSLGRKNKKQVDSMISLGFLLFEGFLLLACALVVWKAEVVLQLIVPGWSSEQIASTVPLLRILMPFILCVSSSALLAGALQSVGHFFVPAFAPVLLNIVFITALLMCMFFSLPVEYLCIFILLGGILQFIFHLFMYFKLHFTFGAIDPETKHNFKAVLIKFLPCFVSMSVMELSLFIDTSFASYLPSGSMSLIYYADRFMGIPLGVFAVAFSTILLPHFSRVGAYAPKRLSFYLLETAKFVLWITLPVILMMSFFAEKIFHTLFLSEKFSLADVQEAKVILIVFMFGLFFFSLNKILLNLYYALHVTWVPAIISVIAMGCNAVLNYILMMRLQAAGIALATIISVGVMQTLLFVWFLYTRYNFRFYSKAFFLFFIRYMLQLTSILGAGYFIYRSGELCIALLPARLAHFMLYEVGFWLWVGPLCAVVVLAIYYLRNLFKVQLYFLD